MTIVKTPMNYDTVELKGDSKVFWKQILPLGGSVSVNGSKLEFSKAYLTDILGAYKQQAYPQVPFQLVRDDNQHPKEHGEQAVKLDPERFRGDIQDMKIVETGPLPGLYAKFELTDKGVALIKENKKLGVSSSLVHNYTRGDGKHFPVAIGHVVGTLDPKVVGMSPWIQLSNADGDMEVVDLSETVIEKEGQTKPADKPDEAKSENSTGTTAGTVTVPEAEWKAIVAFVNKAKSEDEELEKVLKGGNEGDKKTSDLSNSTNAPAQPSPEVVQLSNRVAKSEFDRYADAMKRQGVPPVMLDHAAKVLGVSDYVQLSNDGGESDPRAVIRKILDEAKGTVDLSNARGHESAEDKKASQDAYDAAKAFMTGPFA